MIARGARGTRAAGTSRIYPIRRKHPEGGSSEILAVFCLKRDRKPDPVAGVSAGRQECSEQQGGTLCYIPVWAKLPPAKVP